MTKTLLDANLRKIKFEGQLSNYTLQKKKMKIKKEPFPPSYFFYFKGKLVIQPQNKNMEKSIYPIQFNNANKTS